MKIDIHNSIIDRLISSNLYNSLNKLVNALVERDKSIKKIQMYGDFYLPDEENRFGKYTLMDEKYVYYPLTLIHRNKKWNIQWIRWKREDVHIKCPFVAVREPDIQICDSVPEEFILLIEGKELVYYKNSKQAYPEFGLSENKSIGRINQRFIDEVASQISEEISNNLGVELSSKWGISPCERESTYKIDGKMYRMFQLSSSKAECISLGVTWSGDYDINDYVSRDCVKFELTEYEFTESISSFEEIKEFITNNGFVYTDNVVKDENRLNCSFPDVTLVFSLSKKPDKAEREEILKCVREFVEKWNEMGGTEPIHDFFLIDSEDDKDVSVFIDFGNCMPSVLENLLKHFKENLSIKVRKIDLL